jgi:acetolactate synthase-1/2/3 large subunit
MYKIWFARCYRTRNANALLLDNALATMGAGLPSAMMAAPPPSRPSGAGSLRRRRLHDELAGARDRRRLKLNLVVLIIQDDAYGMIRWKQAVDSFSDLGAELRQPRLRQVRRRIRGRRDDGSSPRKGLVPTLEAAFEEGGVQLVAVPVDYSENTRVLVDELRNKVREVTA